jgi:hypothetical protein
LDSLEFAHDGLLVGRELIGQGGEELPEFRIAVLRRESLRPVEREIEMAAPVVERAEFASGALVVLEKLAGRGVEGFGEDFRLLAAARLGQVLERRGQCEEFPERIPAQVILRGELLHVLGRGAAGSRFEESAAIHQRDDGKHLRAGSDFEDGEKVGKVVAQNVAGDRNGVFSPGDAFEAE